MKKGSTLGKTTMAQCARESCAGEVPSAPAMPDPDLSVDDYLPALLAQASQLISTEFHATVRTHGLSVLEWRVLATLAGSGAITIGHLAQKSVSKQPTVTRLLDRMEQLGHVERLADHSDRRLTRVRMTRSGKKMISALVREARAHEAAVLAPLGDERSQALKHVLQELIARYRHTGTALIQEDAPGAPGPR